MWLWTLPTLATLPAGPMGERPCLQEIDEEWLLPRTLQLPGPHADASVRGPVAGVCSLGSMGVSKIRPRSTSTSGM